MSRFCGVGSSSFYTSTRGENKVCIGVTILLQFQRYTLPPTISYQLQWGRFNTKGRIGKNIPCHLYNEQINRIFKETIINMGSNFTEHSTTRAARSVTFLENIVQGMDEQCSVTPDTTTHCTRSGDHDIRQVVKVVLQITVTYSYSQTLPLPLVEQFTCIIGLRIWVTGEIQGTAIRETQCTLAREECFR